MLSALFAAPAQVTDVIGGLGDAGIAALLGYAVVFVGITLLMTVILIMGKVMTSRSRTAVPTAPAAPAAAVPDAPVKTDLPKAPGSAGELKLYDTDPKTAAMLMAIVADKTGKPINELRFKSIKEIK